jgi:FkbM family methyltransferase
MSIQRAVINLLDRPGGRTVLGGLTTRFARKITGTDIEIAYKDGLWTSRIGRYFLPDSEHFNYFTNSFAKSASQVEEYFANAKDYWFHAYRPQRGDVIVDIGAGCGEDTLAFSEAVGESGRVIAIEAHPATFRLLESFCRLNRIHNATPVWLALMGNAGSVSMVESKSWEGHSVDLQNSVSSLRVPASTLDALCERLNIKDIAFLKMNIEGAERDAIKGMTRSIAHVRTICVACHDFRADRGDGEHFRTRHVVESFLVENGFRLAYRPDDARPFVRDHIHGFRSR